MDQKNQSHIKNILLRPDKIYMLVLRVFFSIIIVLFVIDLSKKAFSLDGCLIVLFLILIYLSLEIGTFRSYFKYSNGIIEYVHMYGKKISVKQNEISKSWLEVGMRKDGGIVRVVVEPNKMARWTQFNIAISAYDNYAYKKMVEILKVKTDKNPDPVEKVLTKIYKFILGLK